MKDLNVIQLEKIYGGCDVAIDRSPPNFVEIILNLFAR